MTGEIASARDLQFRRKFVNNGKATWRVWVAALVLGAFVVPVEHWAPGWSRPIGACIAAVGSALIVKRRYWGFTWFWIVVFFLAVAQVPIIIITKPWMDLLKYLFMSLLTLVDLFLLSFVIELVAARFASNNLKSAE
jgi:hypothetical protein